MVGVKKPQFFKSLSLRGQQLTHNDCGQQILTLCLDGGAGPYMNVMGPRLDAWRRAK